MLHDLQGFERGRGHPVIREASQINPARTAPRVVGFLVAAKPTTLVEISASGFFLLSFFLSFSQSSKEGPNSPNKHGSICNLGHKFQI